MPRFAHKIISVYFQLIPSTSKKTKILLDIVVFFILSLSDKYLMKNLESMKLILKSVLFAANLIVGQLTISFAATPTYNIAKFADAPYPNAIAADSSDDIIMAYNDGVKKFIKSTGASSLITGSGANKVSVALALAIDSAFGRNVIYTVDQNNRVIKLAYNAATKTYAQTIIATNEAVAAAGATYDPHVKFSANFGGGGVSAVRAIGGIAVDNNQNIYLADKIKHVIWKLTCPTTPTGKYTLSVVAGTLGVSGIPTANASTKFNAPLGLAFNASWNLLVADSGNRVVQQLVFTATGALVNASVLVGVAGQYNGPNDGKSPISPCLYGPKNITLDRVGNLYIADSYVDLVRYVSGNVIRIIAGTTEQKSNASTYSGISTGTRLLGLSGVAVDSTGIIYITEANNMCARKMMKK